MAIIRKKKFIPDPLVGVGLVIGRVFQGGCVAVDTLEELAFLDGDVARVVGQLQYKRSGIGRGALAIYQGKHVTGILVVQQGCGGHAEPFLLGFGRLTRDGKAVPGVWGGAGGAKVLDLQVKRPGFNKLDGPGADLVSELDLERGSLTGHPPLDGVEQVVRVAQVQRLGFLQPGQRGVIAAHFHRRHFLFHLQVHRIPRLLLLFDGFLGSIG